MRFWKSSVPLVAVALCAACAGNYVWIDEYRASARAGSARPSYEIAPGDVISVRVFNQDQISTKARVRADGKVTLPLLNDVEAAGLTPVALANQVQDRLKELVKNPLVSVSVEESRPRVVYVAGEVAKPGPYPLDEGTTLLGSLVNAGGLTPYAHKDQMFVIRAGDPAVRIRFTYEALTRLTGAAARFRLVPGDTIVVE